MAEKIGREKAIEAIAQEIESHQQAISDLQKAQQILGASEGEPSPDEKRKAQSRKMKAIWKKRKAAQAAAGTHDLAEAKSETGSGSLATGQVPVAPDVLPLGAKKGKKAKTKSIEPPAELSDIEDIMDPELKKILAGAGATVDGD
jgi:hypothetical protein